MSESLVEYTVHYSILKIWDIAVIVGLYHQDNRNFVCYFRYILITGCDTGFGNLTAKKLDSLGCHVFAGCLTETGEVELKKSCSSSLVTIHLDISKSESVRNVFEIVQSKLPPGTGMETDQSPK